MHTGTLIRPSAGDDTTAGMPTICAAFQATAARYPNRLALRLPGEGIEWTWDEYAARVRRAAHTLHALGVRRGDRVALLLRNRPEHLLADLAAVHLGATPFSIYATSAPPQVAYLVRDSGACVLITEAAFEATAAAVAPRCGGLEHVLRMTSDAPELDSIESPAFEFEQSWRAVTPADAVCLVYTSTTTGPPKGAEITHQGVLANLRATSRTLHTPEELTAVSFLPLAHLVERLTNHYSAIALARMVTCCPDAAALALALAETRRTAFGAPPRMREQLRTTCETLRDDHNLPQQTAPALDQHGRFHTGDLGRLGVLTGAVSTTNPRLSRVEQINRHTIPDADVASLPHQPGTREDQRSRQNSVSLRQTAERSHVKRP
ncbi:MAG: AMP-binding protein [Solirubrobacteraceae bacterium]